MEVNFKRFNSTIENDYFKALFSEIYHSSSEENVNKAYRLFRNRLALIEELYDIDVTKMNDVDYGMFINLNYSIDLTTDEYIDIYNKTNSKDYLHYPILKTNLVTEVPFITSDEGLHSSWILTQAKISYEVFIDKKIAFDPNKEYTLEELEKMINNKDLVLLNVFYQKLKANSYDEKDVNQTDTSFIPVASLKKCSERHNDCYKEYIKVMRTIITNKRILEDLREYVLDYKKTLNNFLSNMPYLKMQQEIAIRAQNKINGSDEYSELLDLIDKLNNKKTK